MNTEFPRYDAVEQALETLQHAAPPAELHGLMCAMISGGQQIDGGMLINPLLGETIAGDPATAEARTVLLSLYEASSHKLQDFEFDFQLLLPEDDLPLSVRAEAISHWCQGYLTGLNLLGIERNRVASEDARDALQRFLNIATLDYDNANVDEEEEKAFIDIIEYVRLATLMLFAEFSKPSDEDAAH